MLTKEYLKEKPVCKVTFSLPEAIQADSAQLLGDFNNWNPANAAMKKQTDGHFTITLDLDKGREYQFRYLSITLSGITSGLLTNMLSTPSMRTTRS
jgi:1,4-alpha-glucan branching enzyme